jgi:hypothetical protein
MISKPVSKLEKNAFPSACPLMTKSKNRQMKSHRGCRWLSRYLPLGNRTALPREVPWPYESFGRRESRLSRPALREKDRAPTGQSCAPPPVNRMAMRRPLASASASIFVLRPPRERPTACFCSPLFRLLPSGALSRAWSRSSACLWIVRSQQARGIDFPRRHAAPNAQSDYRSSSEDRTRAGNRTSDSHS